MKKSSASLIGIFIFLCLSSFKLQGQNAALEYIIGIQHLHYFEFNGDHTPLLDPGRGKFSPRLGLNYYKRVSPRLGFQTGLHFYSRSSKSEKSQQISGGGFLSSSGGGSVKEVQHFNDHWYFEVPTNLRIDFDFKNLNPFVQTGVSTEFYWKSKYRKEVNSANEETSFGKNPEIQNRSIQLNLAFGFNCQLNKRHSLLILPFTKFDLVGQRAYAGRGRNHSLIYGIQLGLRDFID